LHPVCLSVCSGNNPALGVDAMTKAKGYSNIGLDR
jgi:hypothetical protein